MKCRKCGAGDSGRTGFCADCLKLIVAVSSKQAAPEDIRKAHRVSDLEMAINSQGRHVRGDSAAGESSAVSASVDESDTEVASDLVPVSSSSKGLGFAKYQQFSIAVCVISIVLIFAFGQSGKARLAIFLISIAILLLIHFMSVSGGLGSRFLAAVSGALKLAAVIMVFTYIKSCAVNNAGSVGGGSSCELGLGGTLNCPPDY